MDGRLTLPPERDTEHAVQVLRLLAEPTRLTILLLTSQEELSVTRLAELTGRPSTVVSQHLAKLRAAGLVVPRRDGTTIYYSQPHWHLAQLCQQILKHTEHALYEHPPHHR